LIIWLFSPIVFSFRAQTAARLSDQSHFGSLWEDGEKKSLSD
jgi:hypothetical protein